MPLQITSGCCSVVPTAGRICTHRPRCIKEGLGFGGVVSGLAGPDCSLVDCANGRGGVEA